MKSPVSFAEFDAPFNVFSANALTFVVLLAMGWVAWSVERRERE